MQGLSNTISDHYFLHFQQLTTDKQIHLASRLYLWNGYSRAAKALLVLQPVLSGDIPAILKKIEEDVQSDDSYTKDPSYALRQGYFEKYPKLRTYTALLFRMALLKNLYDQDHVIEFQKLYEIDQISNLYQNLLGDSQALKVLSTSAVNFLYLYNQIIGDRDYATVTQRLDEVANLFKGDPAADPVAKRLELYFYTHCIIGASDFYAHDIPKADQAIYHKLLTRAEAVIKQTGQIVSLDAKLEFLVSAQLANFTTDLEESILAEAANNYQPDNGYIADPQRLDKSTFEQSEHRNSLFIMAIAPRKVVSTSGLFELDSRQLT